MSVKDDRVDLVIADGGADLGPGQRLVWEMATRLSRTRFALQVWLPADASRDPLADALVERDVHVERPAGAASGWRGWFGTWRKLRRLKPTLLHLHHPLGARGRWSMALAELCSEARVVISQGPFATASSGTTRLLERRLMARADAVVAPVTVVADSLVRELGVPRDRLRVIADGVDLPDDEAEIEPARRLRRDLGAGLFKPLWVCPVPLEAGRGHRILLHALARVRDGGAPFLALWSGDGPMRSELERLVAELDLGDRVRFGVPGVAPGTLLAAADLVVMPAPRSDDAAPLIEAIVRARPIVAGASGAASELLENGATARLVPIENAGELALALDFMVRHQDAARRMGVAAAERIGEDHAWPRVAEELEAVYDDLLGLATFTPDSAAEARR